jgi:hypothetical protein
MTFVLNVLHKDFSLIAADRQGNATGPITLKIGEMTVHVNSPKTTIEGMRKIVLSDDRSTALGFAGTTGDHDGYRDAFSRVTNPVQAMKCVREHMESKFQFDQRDILLRGQGVMINQVLLTFFDAEKSAFFTSYNAFTPFENQTNLYARRENPAPTLVHAGTGSSKLEEAIGLDSINKFISDVKEGADLVTQLGWIEETFKAVSAVASGCGEEFDAVIATRENPCFTSVHGFNR